MQKLANLLGGGKSLFKAAKALKQWMCMTQRKGKAVKGLKEEIKGADSSISRKSLCFTIQQLFPKKTRFVDTGQNVEHLESFSLFQNRTCFQLQLFALTVE